MAYLGNHNQAESQVVEPQMKGFEQKFPGAKVEVTNLTAGYDEKLQSMLAAGTPPDMFRTGGTGWAQYANQGAMAEIGSRVKRDKYDLTDLIEAAVEQYHWKGKHLGLGSNVGYSLFYYNTALFSENGVPAPSDDWTEALDLRPVYGRPQARHPAGRQRRGGALRLYRPERATTA